MTKRTNKSVKHLVQFYPNPNDDSLICWLTLSSLKVETIHQFSKYPRQGLKRSTTLFRLLLKPHQI